MAKNVRKMDTGLVQLSLPLSSLPTAGLPAGSLRRQEAVHEAFRAVLATSGLTPEYVASELSRLTGNSISVHHINNWTAESKIGERHIPLDYLPALTAILRDSRLIQAVMPTGWTALTPEDAAVFELGKVVVEERRRGRKKRELWERINGSGA
ncbi:hypothetical protein [Desulfolutivibrio sulfodismutans]|uniref:hypothetical protein n=1 Tax=Desulfolutivibrio sulfodismutans TaxID=63561 RepID=UPI001C4065E1|nr:hypothetical protein [Desulfolutivibrio sulfodismutans]